MRRYVCFIDFATVLRPTASMIPWIGNMPGQHVVALNLRRSGLPVRMSGTVCNCTSICLPPSLRTCRCQLDKLHMNRLQDDLLADIFRQLSLHERWVHIQR